MPLGSDALIALLGLSFLGRWFGWPALLSILLFQTVISVLIRAKAGSAQAGIGNPDTA